MSGCTDASTLLANLKIVPISLVTFFDLTHLNELSGSALSFPREPHKDYRELKTFRQSDGGTIESNYHRLTRGGLPIHDSGFAVEELSGVVSLSSLKPILGAFTAATLIWVNENKLRPQARPIWKKKIELRWWHDVDPERQGALDIDQLATSLSVIPDEMLVDVRVWLNPNKSTGWWQINLVCRCWDQGTNRKAPISPLETMMVEDIPTIDLERYGFQF
ncbi:MAG: hypothetical protein Q8Q05_02730 [bacterium]|nr:hypothetical protein [bacterium]